MYIESYMLIVGSFLNLTIGVFGMFYQANKALNLNMAVPTTKEENEKIGYNECFEGNLLGCLLYSIWPTNVYVTKISQFLFFWFFIRQLKPFWYFFRALMTCISND